MIASLPIEATRARFQTRPSKPLGREMLEWVSIRLMQAAQYYWPFDAEGKQATAHHAGAVA